MELRDAAALHLGAVQRSRYLLSVPGFRLARVWRLAVVKRKRPHRVRVRQSPRRVLSPECICGFAVPEPSEMLRQVRISPLELLRLSLLTLLVVAFADTVVETVTESVGQPH